MAGSAALDEASVDMADETFAADGKPLASEEGNDEEEIIDQGGSKSASDPFELALAELEVLMMDESLNDSVDAFTKEHCKIFEHGDENKLEYTTLFTKYTTMIEENIEQKLGASLSAFDMASFCTTLQERVKADESLMDHPALEMLFAYTDFDAFKTLMLSTKDGASVEADGGALFVGGEQLGLAGAGSAGLPGFEDGYDVGVGGETLATDLSISGLSVGKAAA